MHRTTTETHAKSSEKQMEKMLSTAGSGTWLRDQQITRIESGFSKKRSGGQSVGECYEYGKKKRKGRGVKKQVEINNITPMGASRPGRSRGWKKNKVEHQGSPNKKLRQ